MNRACKWNRKRSPFTSAKLSLGDIMATDMHASDDAIMKIYVEIDRNSIKYVLDILNNILLMHMQDMESVIFT